LVFEDYYYNKNNFENGGINSKQEFTTSINKINLSSILTGTEIGIVGVNFIHNEQNFIKLNYKKWLIQLFGESIG
jgi:hypothetical protein